MILLNLNIFELAFLYHAYEYLFSENVQSKKCIETSEAILLPFH